MNDNLRVTKRMQQFLYNKTLPHYILYSNKDGRAFCTACQSEVDIKALGKTKPLLEKECPKCKANVLLKAQGQVKKNFHDDGVGIILDKEDNNVCVRYFDVLKIYNPDGTVIHFDYHECMREYIDKNGKVITYNNPLLKGGWKKCSVRKYSNWKGVEGSAILHINTNWKHRAIYNGNIKSVINGTPWQYSLMDKIFKLHDSHHYYDAMTIFLRDYVKCPIHEYLYKVGFTKLCAYLTFDSYIPLNPQEKTIVDILKLNKENYKKLLAIGNPTFEDLRKHQIMTEYDLSETDYVIWSKYFNPDNKKIYSFRYTYDGDTENMLRKYYKKSWEQFDKYMQNKISMRDYADYLKMCDELGYDMKNTFIIFPKHFEQAHQNVVNEWNALKNEKEREKAKKRNNEYDVYREKYSEIYSFEEDNLKVVVPNGCDEICAEGQNLRHCVGTYIDKVCKGLSVILFIRKINELNKSFYTMEVRGNEIIQVHGFGNKDMTEEVRNLVTDFAKQKQLTMFNL